MIEDLPVQLTDSTAVEIGAQSPLTTMIIATAFGMIVALLHLLAHRERPTYKLWRTLLLISPLIAMATMAVGTNLAAAFTLFGTLAIVRFRTPIKEPMDAAFVIFSVVIGLATGNQSFMVALIGTTVIAVTILILLAINKAGNGNIRGRLRLVLKTTDTSASNWRDILNRLEIEHSIRSCSIDEQLAVQNLTLELNRIDPEHWPRVLSELMADEHVVKANGGPLED